MSALPVKREPEYEVIIDRQSLGAGPSSSLGLAIDVPTLLVKALGEAGLVAAAVRHHAETRGYTEPIDVGDQLIAINGATAASAGGPSELLAALADEEAAEPVTLALRRGSEWRRQAKLGAEGRARVAEGEVVVLSEGEDARGVSGRRWRGEVASLGDEATPGYGAIRCGDAVLSHHGFTRLAAPSYILGNGQYQVGDWVSFVVAYSRAGRPRARHLLPERSKSRLRAEAPWIDAAKPLADDISWASAPTLRRPGAHDATGASAASRELREASSQDSSSATESVSSASDSDKSISVGGGRRARSRRGVQRALREPSEQQRWTEREWLTHLSKTGELGAKLAVQQPAPSSSQAADEWGVVLEQAPLRQDNALVYVGALEQEPLQLAALLAGGQQELSRTSVLDVESPVSGFSARALAARDAQTQMVTEMLLRNMPPDKLLVAVSKGLAAGALAARPRMPQLRTAEIFEQKLLLESLRWSLPDSSSTPGVKGMSVQRRSHRGGGGGSGGWIPQVGVVMNGPLYACAPPPLAGGSALIGQHAASPPARAWL